MICAHDADKLECLLQAVEYREQGCSSVQPWIDSSVAKLKTAAAQRLADAALTMTSIEWQQTCLPWSRCSPHSVRWACGRPTGRLYGGGARRTQPRSSDRQRSLPELPRARPRPADSIR